ncbi:MAG: histidine phosphatase family protein [Cyanobium sp. LacPavin_0920_WC12_MAG_62_9]|nr:histidine phosphatase family protein [Cyanobium sp. LacPavin_0920_WC12_MAG_62_9]
MVELLLLRHGIAEERCPERVDGERALTAVGRSRTRAVAERLVQLDLGCDQLVTSPLVRARQTAEIAVGAGLVAQGSPSLSLRVDAVRVDAVRVDAALAPGGDPLPLVAEFQRAASAHKGLLRLALVGHEPDLGALAAQLIGAPEGAIALKKAGIALLLLGPGLGQLKLLMAPRQLLATQ